MRSFYDEVLLEHNLHPAHQGTLPAGNVEQNVFNASCGDDLVIELLMDGTTVVDARWHGRGCAISQASADLMAEAMIGADWKEVERLYEKVQKLVVGELSEKETEKLGELGALGTVARMPARVKCAKLPWKIVELAGEVRDGTQDDQRFLDEFMRGGYLA